MKFEQKMLKISEIKISELQRYVDISTPAISKYFKGISKGITKSSNRITGVSPEEAEIFLDKHSAFKFNAPAITLAANLCGGVGKTSSTMSLALALSRITNREKHPIVFIDGDSQGSLTYMLCGERAENDEPTLIDYLEKKSSLDNILHPLGNNIFVIKSNLNLAFLDKVLNKPSDIKTVMRNFYVSLLEHFGENVKIFQDHTPQLSNLFASSVSALYQMPGEVISSIMIPLRSDNFAIQGARYIIQEIEELQETYSFNKANTHIHPFISSFDRRVSSSADALKKVMSDELLQDYLCPVVVRYSADITKSIMACSNIYAEGKKSNATYDYQDLLQYIFNQGIKNNG